MKPFLLVIFFYLLPIPSFSDEVIEFPDEVIEFPDEVELETELEFDVIDLSSQKTPNVGMDLSAQQYYLDSLKPSIILFFKIPEILFASSRVSYSHS